MSPRRHNSGARRRAGGGGTPATIPGEVTGASATPNDVDGEIDLAWSAPASDGGSAITGYQAFRDQPDWTSSLLSAASFTYNLTNFPGGFSYVVKIRAVNAIGPGPWTEFLVPIAGGGSGGTGNGFRADIMETDPTHYFPMTDQYPYDDQGVTGGKELSNTGGGVTFTSAGARFQGVSNDYLTAPTSPDWQIGRTDYVSLASPGTDASAKTVVSFFFAVKFTDYDQPTQFHWMGVGGNAANNYGWAMRLYGDSSSDRGRGVSNYYWNPHPSFDINGASVPDRRGSGAYLAPPEGDRTPYNAPVGSGNAAVEHWFYIVFTYAGTNGYAGRCKMYYGDVSNAMALGTRNRAMNADALVTPVVGNGPLYIGKRGDSDGMVDATIRRLAFWNRELSLSELQSFANSTSMAKTEDGT